MSDLHRSTPAELKARLELERRGVAFVAYADGEGRQRLVELAAPHRRRLAIGRQPASDIALGWDDEVSRAHAEIECIGEVWTLVDDGRSRNGSYVNGDRVHGRRPLQDGDVLRIGRTTLTYVAPAGARAASTAISGTDVGPAITAAQRRVLVALCRPFAAGRFATAPSNRELAEELCLSVETVKLHLRALFAAFGLEDLPQHGKRAALARRALEQGVVVPRELLG